MELRNKFDKEVKFDNLGTAKNYYLPDEEKLSKDSYIGDDFEGDSKKWKSYRDEIRQAESLEELAEVLNRYTDIFLNGSEWYILKK